MTKDERVRQKKLTKKKAKRKKVLVVQKFAKSIVDDFELVDEPLKMSEVLMEFVEPLAELDESDENRRESLAVGVVAWNLALMPETKRQKLLEETLVDLFKSIEDSQHDKEEMETVLKFLIDRKKQYFAHINRFIVEYKVTGSGDSLHLTVASTVT